VIYVALLRGINVGGKRKVDMATLSRVFERVGAHKVRTYINSGNVIFTDNRPPTGLARELETAIEDEFGFHVKVLLRDLDSIRTVTKAIPDDWVNDRTERTDVWFLWEDHDSPDVVEGLTVRDGIDEVFYVDGAVVWRADGEQLTKSGRGKVIGTRLYKSLTARNVNTVRKIHSIMEEVASG
jgi:uncharacterized protein (DUF1697 family)